MKTSTANAPAYANIKNHLLHQIETGELKPGDKVASENTLVNQFSVSRMTARRALTELQDEGVLIRTQGLGTFVADQKASGSMLEIRNIADEISERGHSYSSRILNLEARPASGYEAARFGVQEGSTLFFSRIVHCDNGTPLQLEERWVSAERVPDYLQQDFSQQTPNAYLSQVAPLTEADHMVEAVLPSHDQAQLLDMVETAPCLQVIRHTYSRNGMISLARLIHPGNRYRLGGHIQFNTPL
ncbi:histidine utilization repressor [Oceanospirillum beijerinckii]|uniref:histidine utilization repressor n=1 Tax=Oceanospirillum beijerinckii TaxID=64976 RepID=UPI00040E85BC|nr:histidine utilization repressor [Oceanospirillum beijerinckii]MAC46217.1 histidine utilization repressor [Oceanospirillum sp.]